MNAGQSDADKSSGNGASGSGGSALMKELMALQSHLMSAAGAAVSPEPLPEGLFALKDRAERLFERIAHLDRRLYLEGPVETAANPVLSQYDLLNAAFGGVA